MLPIPIVLSALDPPTGDGMHPLPLRTRVFVFAVASAAAPLPVVALAVAWRTINFADLAALSLLFVLSVSIGSRGSHDMATITLGSVVAIAALPIVGVWGAILQACCCMFDGNREAPVKRVFNTSQVVLAAGASGLAFHLLGGHEIRAGSFPGILVPFAVALVVHCLVNGLLVACIVTIDQRVPLRVVFQGTMAGSVAGYVGYGLFGLLLAVLWDNDGAAIGPAAALLVLLPLYVARWAYEQYAEQQRAYDRTVRALIAAVETKDVYTRGHSERVSAASVLIARQIGMREDRVASLRYAGLLHDIGKLGVPTRVLQKAGKLTDDELAAVQLHPVRGLEMVREIEFLGEALAGIMHHHERLDGRGYPMGLAGQQIPEFARVIAVADAFDSMTTTRSYRGARTIEQTLVELQACSGTQFDPPMVAALVTAIEANGWQVETTPLFPSAPQPVPDGHYDHDDPASLALPSRAS